VYNHQPRSRVPLDPVYHGIYRGDHLVWALQSGLEFGRLRFHPVTGHFQVLAGIIVAVV
jgi:hypothetical protein